jgi:hypothetical protein
MAMEDHVERLAHRLELGVLEGALGEGRGVARGEQQSILLAERNLQSLEDPEQHLAARLRAAGLDEAQMAGRDPSLESQLELGDPPSLAPLTQDGPDGL